MIVTWNMSSTDIIICCVRVREKETVICFNEIVMKPIIKYQPQLCPTIIHFPITLFVISCKIKNYASSFAIESLNETLAKKTYFARRQ